ncbi:hypothetical protein [Paraburkholderia xenovorans]
MPSPRKSTPNPEADTSRKKEVAGPKKTADKAQSHKGTQVAKRAKSKAKG